MADSALEAAEASDLVALKEELDDSPSPDLGEVGIYAKMDQIVCAAAHSRHAGMVTWLLESRFPTYVPRLQAHLAAIQGGPDVYDVFLQKWPHLINYELGHNGNPIGLSVLDNDMPMVKFVLGKGVDPNTAQYGHRQFNKPENFPTWCAHVDKDVIDLLVGHGLKVTETPEQESRDA
ncbi:hypothetical protein B0A48_18565 [Cryoendolithus antarcticus]|uniref:Ankyrin repeat-containing protein n=1 Tax=Cryoendolithus antarcticus TaxID=1507870 RepID=A0A1V8S7S2_9PEZI|nr:hypothetical protein B0A48_18565 [Cryoendolithus antarcticus]